MRQWYESYYKAIPQSKAYSEFCRRVFGRDMGQHGFSDLTQIDRLIELAALGPADRALDLGCGNGQMAEYISDRTGAHLTGLDYIPTAIEQAQRRSAGKRDRLDFVVGDIGSLPFAPRSFDVLISIDTLYFTDLDATVGQMKRLLKSGGHIAIFYGHGASPE
ncbi:MAG: class I SAM-dependent methyltransferase, partial [Anaerolineae bacterium]|nr:class I SAM-dependent methyltransferase [Anaerolineae bacterium]